MNVSVSGLVLANITAPTSAELRAWVSDETGTGNLVFSTSPALTTPVVTGGITSATSNGIYPVYLAAAPQALSGAGAVNVTSHKTNVTSTGANALTLADGAVVGQVKVIQMIVDGGDATLTPTNLAGGTTITFADVGDVAVLIWNGTAWRAIDLYNCADGATAPVLA